MDHLERIWAPWRLSYVQPPGQSQPASSETLHFPAGADPDCFLCQAAVDPADRSRWVIARGESSLAVLNRYPYNNGHTLVAPMRHVGGLEDLAAAEHLEIATMITRLVGVLRETLNAEGFNVGLNLGRTAGAGLPDHIHWHIVPRWLGDTNFMPSLAGVKVIPQSLEALWETLARRLGSG